MKKGIIALDIDGTIADPDYKIHSNIIEYLRLLHSSGWVIAFVTGRSYDLSYKILKCMPFAFYHIVQNGADILDMFSKKTIDQSYLSRKQLEFIDLEFKTREGNHFLVYSGYQDGDFCYYNPNRFSKKHSNYLHTLQSHSTKPWKAFSHIDEISQHSFPLVKCFGSFEFLQEISESLTNVTTHIIQDTVNTKSNLLLISSASAHKGAAVRRLQNIEGVWGPIIAAGNDRNDITMLKTADISIAIKNAPQEVLKNAMIICDTPENQGIIDGLGRALNL